MDLIPFFPNPFTKEDIYEIFHNSFDDPNKNYLSIFNKYHFVPSGKVGLILLLRSFNLPKDSKVGVPVLICNTVIEAIYKAKLKPHLFDIGNNFQFEFNSESICSNIRAIILPHFYGTYHPQTIDIIKWCEDNNIRLINDTAQSFGLVINGKNVTELGNGGIISFGPGKISTAAGGAVVFGLNRSVKLGAPNFLSRWFTGKIARVFLVNRTVGIGNELTKYLEKLFFYLNIKYVQKEHGFLHPVQYSAINKYMEIRREISESRHINWSVLHNNLDKKIFLIPREFINSGKYKYVFYINSDKEKIIRFVKAMKNEKIYINNPSYINSKTLGKFKKYVPNYLKLKHKLLEISTERTIPQQNFAKAAKIMNEYWWRH